MSANFHLLLKRKQVAPVKKQSNYSLTDGPIFKTLLFYSFPIIITNVIQLLFHIIDVTILAVMTDDMAVAAVGACGSLITLLVGIFTGFATGSNVLVARRIGEGNTEGVKKEEFSEIVKVGVPLQLRHR